MTSGAAAAINAGCGCHSSRIRSAADRTLARLRWKRGLRVCLHARREGILLRPLGNVIVILPPLSITLDELDRICLAVERGCSQLAAST